MNEKASYQRARDIQTEMNFGGDGFEQHRPKGFVAATVDYHHRKDAFEFHLWVDGRKHGLNQHYRLDWEIDANALNPENPYDLSNLYRLMNTQIELDFEQERNSGKTRASL